MENFYQEICRKIKTSIEEILVDEIRQYGVEVEADSRSAQIYVKRDGHASCVDLVYIYSAKRPRKLEINWSCLGNVSWDDPYARVLGIVLSYAGVLEQRICRGEIGKKLDEIATAC